MVRPQLKDEAARNCRQRGNGSWNIEEVRPVFFQNVKTGVGKMPWTANDAQKHTHKATTSELKELWAKVANDSLERTNDEGRAVREANAVVARQARSG
jgi:hypothetical protein